MKRLFHTILSLLLIAGFTNHIFACTTFCLKNNGEVLFGKNYDWMIGDGMLFVNKRGVAKTASSGDAPAEWVSKYGSVTFNQYGRENPSGGMNEAGLAIELMWLEDTQYPVSGGRTIDVLEWIQYQLDTAATTAEVIKATENLRITSEVKIHYLVNDKNGNSVTIEFIQGKFVPHSGQFLPVAALANDTYSKSVEYSKTTDRTKAVTERSLDRFTRAADKTKDFDKQARGEKEAVDYAFGILSDVAQKGYTQWSIVYDQRRGKIYFRTQKNPQIKTIDATAFDYACETPVKMLDIDVKDGRDATRDFTNYTREANRSLIERSFSGTPFLKSVPAPVKDALAAAPENFGCGAKSKAVEPRKAIPVEKNNNERLLSLIFPPYFIYKRLASSS